MNHPFPSLLQCRSETAIARLLDEQASDTTLFLAIIRQTQTLIAELRFPLGSPACGYDLCAITAALSDWQIPRDPDQLQEYAEDAVLTLLGGV